MFIENIIKQNSIFDNMTESINENIVYKFSLRSRNPNLEHIVIETTPKIRKLIIENNTINIEWNRCKVAHFISIIRCFNCLGFGHFQDKCKAEKHCSHCSSETHTHDNCDKNYKKCINCENYNSKIKNPNQKPLNTNHDCLNKSCPTFEFIRSLVIAD
jgi:hypothetical protein